MIKRYSNNPVIDSSMVKPSIDGYNILGVFNPGATIYNNQIILLMRIPENCVKEQGFINIPYYEFKDNIGKAKIRKIPDSDPEVKLKDTRSIIYKGIEYPSTVSHLRIARSDDGINFKIDEKPFIYPCIESESLGVEDARISKIDDTYYINYTGVSGDGFVTLLATTKDFKNIERKGIIFYPLTKDVAIFEEKINGKYIALYRPHNQWFGPPSIWYAESPDLIHWGKHKCIMRPNGSKWENVKIGAGAAPIKTEQGWLVIYHGVGDNGIPGTETYSLNIALLDLNEPSKVIKRSKNPILFPKEQYEKNGFVKNVVFTCGTVEKDGQLLIYYGGADTVIGVAYANIKDILKMF